MPVWSSKKARVLIFGTGSGGINFYKSSRRRLRILGFVDNNSQRQGQKLFGKLIYAPHELAQLTFDKVIIASDYYVEIYPQLIGLGLTKTQVEIFHQQAIQNTSVFQRLRSVATEQFLERMYRRKGWVSDLLFALFSRTSSGKQQGLERLPLQWLDQTDEFKVHVFRPALAGQVQGPRFLGQQVPPTKVTLPEVALHHLRQGQVASVSRSVILPDGRLFIERITTVEHHKADYSVAHVVYHGKGLALVRVNEPAQIEKGILINGCSEMNYYHWVLEVLSQLQFIAELPERYTDYPILISGRSRNIPSIRALIDSFGIDRPFIYLDTLQTYRVDDLLFITAPNNMIANFKHSVENTTASTYARAESIQFLREKALSLAQGVPSTERPKRVFLARKGYLRQYNQNEIIDLLRPHGFTSVYMEDLDISRQVAIMASAEMIVGPTGAAWTNIMFASKGTQALCWMAEEYGNLSCFSNLAAIVGVEMDFLTYPTGARNSRELYYRSYHLDATKVRAWIEQRVGRLK
ncbi:glycosyltransferase family 61 protein [Pseudomonas asplenii]|uniref:glycosyltransferase family 61 protein n=1 Tax=Pseudomonas asplenii TaxID=53407 RepID=UPI00223416A5|nr:glycosyltransferase 61 family protein [Pseudomonas asplenii]UZE28255.1 glycosyltransferase 61 family protein [Pseudomonas asplenii]